MTPVLETYRKQLVGKRMKRVLHTDQSKGVEHLNGLGNAYYFSTVLELENGDRYNFSEEWIETWDNNRPLKEVTYDNWTIEKDIQFKNQFIEDILKDEHDSLYILLQNNVVMYHMTVYGDELFFKKHSDLFHADNVLK